MVIVVNVSVSDRIFPPRHSAHDKNAAATRSITGKDKKCHDSVKQLSTASWQTGCLENGILDKCRGLLGERCI